MENSKRIISQQLTCIFVQLEEIWTWKELSGTTKLKKKIQFREATPHSSEKDVYAGWNFPEKCFKFCNILGMQKNP